MNRFLLCIFIYISLFITKTYAQASFTAPDTVCIFSPVNIKNTSVGASTYFWNFCSGNLYGTPKMTNLGNVGNILKSPSFMATAQDGNNFYAFVINYGAGSLVRLSFGNSFLNTPVAEDLGTFNGVIPIYTEGVQVVKDAIGWHVIIVGGAYSDIACIVKVDFGASLSGTTPVATNWGNIGALEYPTGLYVFEESGLWYGLTVNYFGNTVTRFSFGADFSGTPTGLNMGNIGNLDRPTGIRAIKENGNWYVFVANEQSSSISRLDFGTSLVNIPTGHVLGNPNNVLNGPRDLTIIHDCGSIFAMAVNNFSNDLVRVDFGDDITATSLRGTKLGNTGGLSFPCAITSIFREGDNLYAFIANNTNNTITRLEFNTCNNSTVSSSTAAAVATFAYDREGTYAVHLVTDEALASPSTFCKNIVVMPEVYVDLGRDTMVCAGTVIRLSAGGNNKRYLWSTGATTPEIDVRTTGTYKVTATNGYCSTTDEISITVIPPLTLNQPTITNIDCGVAYGSIEVHPSGGTRPYTFYVNGITTKDSVYTHLEAGDYTIRIVGFDHCEVSQTYIITENSGSIIRARGGGTSLTCNGAADGTIAVEILKGTGPFEYAIAGQPFQRTASFKGLNAGTYKVYIRNSACMDSVEVTLAEPAAIKLDAIAKNEICERGNGEVSFSVTGGYTPYRYYWDNVLQNNTLITGLSKGSYELSVMDANKCNVDTTINLSNIDLPPVHITNRDTTVNVGDVVELHAINAVDYLWTPAAGLSCIDCPSPLAKPLTPTTYIVQTVTGLNCIPADTVTINLTYNRSLFAPSAFSPNGDGVNDVFRVKGNGVAYYSMTIYNRWGGLIYRTSDMNKGWDGIYHDKLQDGGVYVYAIEYAFYGKESTKLMQKGTVTLIK
jgi:gliding motility-associated-like protein